MIMSYSPTEMGRRLRSKRVLCGLSQEELADKLLREAKPAVRSARVAVDRHYISGLETGTKTVFSLKLLHAIAHMLHTPILYIIWGIGPESCQQAPTNGVGEELLHAAAQQ